MVSFIKTRDWRAEFAAMQTGNKLALNQKKNAMFDNYGYFARNLRYVINVTHRNLRYGTIQPFINPPYSPGLGQKESS